MPGGSSCGRDSPGGRQGDVQAATQSPLNSSTGTGSNASSFLAALRMEWRCKGGVHPPSTWRNHPSTAAGYAHVWVISYPWPGWTW